MMEVGLRFLMWFPEPVPGFLRVVESEREPPVGTDGLRKAASDRGGQVTAFGRRYETTFTGEIVQSFIEGCFANGA